MATATVQLDLHDSGEDPRGYGRPAEVRLRQALKQLKRNYGFVCAWRPAPPPAAPPAELQNKGRNKFAKAAKNRHQQPRNPSQTEGRA